MRFNTKVSVVVPTSGRLSLLRRAIQSVMMQTYREFELIVVNDAPQHSAAVEQMLADMDADRRIRLLNHSQQRGANAARNTGINAAGGSVVAFLDDDDYWLPRKLEAHMQVHEQEPTVGIVHAAAYIEWIDGLLPTTVVRTGPAPADVIRVMGRAQFSPLHPTVRRVCFETCGGFDESLVSFQDWDKWFAIAHRYSFRYIDEPLTIIGVHLGSRISQDVDKRTRGLMQVIAKWGEEVDGEFMRRTQLPAILYNGIRNATLRGDRWQAARLLRRLIGTVRSRSQLRFLWRALLMVGLGKRCYVRTAWARAARAPLPTSPPRIAITMNA